MAPKIQSQINNASTLASKFSLLEFTIDPSQNFTVKPMRFQNQLIQRQRGSMKSALVIFLLLLIIAPIAYTAFVMSWSYSTGERAGWLQKISHKGFVCKTYEGELSMIAVPGAAPEKFFFTVRDEAVAKQMDQLMGHRVSLHYEEKIGVPTSCFGDTSYFVTGVTTIDEPTFGTRAAVPAPTAPTISPAASAPVSQ